MQNRVGIFVCVAAVVCAQGAVLDFDADMVRGHRLVDQKNFSEARALYSKALASEQISVRSMAQLAIAQSYVIEGKYNEARAAYAKVPSDAPAHQKMEASERASELDRRSRGEPARDPAETRTKLKPLAPVTMTLHVAPSGSNQNSGTREKPFASLQRARDEVRRLKRDGKTGNGTVEVLVHGGEYRVTETFSLTSDDSGTIDRPIVYRAAPGEKPVFRGGVRLGDFRAVSDAKVRARLPWSIRSRVVEADLGRAGVSKVLPLKLGGFASGNGFITHPAHELFFNGKAMQLARGPNEGFLRVKEIAVDDGTKEYDRKGSKVGQFYYEGSLPSKWKDEPSLFLYGYWFWDWADSYERVKAIDTQKRMITLETPYSNYGYRAGAPFYAINALSELDKPGEWYLDRENKRVYLYPPGNMTGATVELSLFDQTMVSVKYTENVRFEGLTWELGSADGILVEANQIVFVGCTIRNFAGTGIHLFGGWNCGILSCDIYSMGRGGTTITGGERNTLKPSGHFIENCEVHDLSRIDHTYTPAVFLDGVGSKVAHNHFYNVASSAVRVNGNDHVIEFNEVYDVVQESDDQGGADMYGNATFRGNIFRFNSWRRIGNWEGKQQVSTLGQAGIRLDDAISGTVIYGNIFERCSSGKLGFGAIQIHGGKDNIIDNNLFTECAAAISFTAWDDARWDKTTADALENPAIDRRLYLGRYPALGRLRANANENYLWRNRTMQVGEFIRRTHQRVSTFDNRAVDRYAPAEEIPGFRRIPYEEIGTYKDAYRK